ncbi:MAG TPA: TfoX/Sxy family protein [Candidatus Dormibacteraeota bacterium]|nr:TfoX/Sxy family protein [Candidatus Dormibacteraeota bacterium]
MPFDVDLARRVREQLAGTSGVTEREMFGGKAFLVHGNMCVGVIREELVARVGPERFPAAMERAGTRPFAMTGRPMSGWVMVAPAGCPDDRALAGWIADAMEYVTTLPRKG